MNVVFRFDIFRNLSPSFPANTFFLSIVLPQIISLHVVEIPSKVVVIQEHPSLRVTKKNTRMTLQFE